MQPKFKIKTLHKVAFWIVKIWFPNVPDSYKNTTIWLNQVEVLIRNHGPIWTIRYIKMLRMIVFAKLSGQPLKAVDMIVGIDRRNFLPKSISYLHNLIESGEKSNIRYVLTLLSVSRAIPGWVDPDLSTISNKGNPSQVLIKDIIDFIPIFCKNYGYKFRYTLSYQLQTDYLKFSNKAGPIGRAAKEALMDLVHMPPILRKVLASTNIGPLMQRYEKEFSKARVTKFFMVQKYWKWFTAPFTGNTGLLAASLNNISQNKRLENLLDPLLSPFSGDFSQEWVNGRLQYSYFLRRLSIVKDPEAKSRIIAIFDFWSQNWLRQFHEIGFDMLKQLSQDRTFTQNPLITNKPDGHKYHSFDLTAATDRFPMQIQEGLIGYLFGADTALSWRMVLTTLPFYVPWAKQDSNQQFVSYEAGQPMGAYSSWTTFTISHHIILHYIHYKLELDEFYYIILGDDIVIYHDDVANEYLRIMKELDVGISLPKSHISSNMYEFAKRIFISGVEVTGVQVRGMLDNYSKYHLIYQMVFDLVYNRGYYPAGLSTIPHLLAELFIVLGHKKKEVKNLTGRIMLLHAFNKFIQFGDKIPFIEEMKRRHPLYEGQLDFPEIEINNFIYSSVDKTIQAKSGEYITYIKDLLTGPKITEQAAWGFADEADIHTSPNFLLSKLPIISAIGNMANVMARSRRLVSDIKGLIEVITLPSPLVLEERVSVRIIGAKAKLAKMILANIDNTLIQGRLPAMPQPNLSSTVLDQIASDVRMSERIIPRNFGMDAAGPAPKVVTTPSTPDPYGAGAQMW